MFDGRARVFGARRNSRVTFFPQRQATARVVGSSVRIKAVRITRANGRFFRFADAFRSKTFQLIIIINFDACPDRNYTDGVAEIDKHDRKTFPLKTLPIMKPDFDEKMKRYPTRKRKICRIIRGPPKRGRRAYLDYRTSA